MYTAYLAYRQHCLLEFFQTRISPCFDNRGIIPLLFDQIVVFVKSQNHINFATTCIQHSSFDNLLSKFQRSIYTETTWQKCRRLAPITFSRTNCHLKQIFNVVFQMLYPEKITELSQVTEKVHHVRTWRRTFILCAM